MTTNDPHSEITSAVAAALAPEELGAVPETVMVDGEVDGTADTTEYQLRNFDPEAAFADTETKAA